VAQRAGVEAVGGDAREGGVDADDVCVPHIGGRPIGEIAAPDALRLLRRIEAHGRACAREDGDWANERFGPGLFKDLDEDMIEAILEDLDHLCPSL
jgi:hypothetical protein